MTVHTETAYSPKCHYTGDTITIVNNDASPGTECGESVTTSGLLGVGKLMASNTSGGTDMNLEGKATTDGADTLDPNVK